MAKNFCSDCGQETDETICPICGAVTDSLSWNEKSPDGQSDRYGDELLSTSDKKGSADDIDEDEELDADALKLDEDLEDQE